jgi:hypothetical protein
MTCDLCDGRPSVQSARPSFFLYSRGDFHERKKPSDKFFCSARTISPLFFLVILAKEDRGFTDGYH